MSDEPSSPNQTGGEPPSTERRHANRVQIEGFEFETGEVSYPVIDLSIGGMRIAYGDDRPAIETGSEISGSLTGGVAHPIALTAHVIWVDTDARHIGCTFPVLGRNIAGPLLEVLL